MQIFHAPDLLQSHMGPANASLEGVNEEGWGFVVKKGLREFNKLGLGDGRRV